MPEQIIKIRLQPKQRTFWELWNDKITTRIGFGGARGGAKSGGGRRCMLLRRFEYANTIGLILRRTYPELYKSHIIKLFEEYPIVRQWWNESRKEINFPNGSKLFFGSAEHEKDMANFYSAEFADILVDEAQEFSQEELEKLTGSNRCTSNNEIVPKMIYTFMPGLSESGIPPKGLNYLKRVFPDQIRRGEENRQKWEFVQAFAWDNIEWARVELEKDGKSEKDFYAMHENERRDYFINRTVFGASLSALTNVYLREAWLDGKWGQFEGQYFQNFRYEKDTIDASEVIIMPWHKRWISGDWGFDHPACFHWHAEDENGQVVTYREFWSIGLGEAELGREIGKLSVGEDIKSFFLSWDAFGKLNKATRKPITQLIAEELPRGWPAPRPADASPGTRISGWRLMHQLIEAGQWKISRACPKLIECLPTLVRDMQRNSEDVLKVDHSDNYIGDDPADSARYGLAEMVAVVRKPANVRVAERVTQIREAEPNATDTHVMMALANIKSEEEKQAPHSFPIRRRINRWGNKYA